MEIRECNNLDIKSVYDLICELKNRKFDYSKFEVAFMDKINSRKNYYIVGIENNNVIAFLSLVIDYQLHHVAKVATIEELIVSSQYRSNGMGKALIENAIEYAKSNQCDVIELTSGFDREKAHKFYEKNGFKKGSYKFKMNL